MFEHGIRKTPYERFNVQIELFESKNKVNVWTIALNRHLKTVPIVLVHGFMGGICDWFDNIEAMSESRSLYAFDMIGFGRSTRFIFSADPIECENQFIECIEKWRENMGLTKMILVGHSFGAYLSTLYALKYPERVSGLILAGIFYIIKLKVK